MDEHVRLVPLHHLFERGGAFCLEAEWLERLSFLLCQPSEQASSWLLPWSTSRQTRRKQAWARFAERGLAGWTSSAPASQS